MNPNSTRWISRKEIAVLIGRSYSSVANSEEFLGLSPFRVRVNRRCVLFYREQTIQQLRARKIL